MRQIYSYDDARRRTERRDKYFSIVFIGFFIVFMIFALRTVSSVLSKGGEQTETSADGEETTVISSLNTGLPRPSLAPEWPKDIQSAVGAIGYGVLAESTTDAKAVPMASLAKVMAAILIMEKDGITKENPGKEIVFNLDDESFYNKYLFEGGVVTTVKVGGKISQREALEAMLITSSNNIADTAVVASFGSVEAYLEAANQKAADLNLTKTKFADVTGFSPQTVSTASELVLLAEYAMKRPLFAEIVGTWETTIMGDIKLTSTNTFLDYENNGVIGIKSGLTDEAGGTFMTAAQYQLASGEYVVALAVTLGAESHFHAQEVAMPLLTAVRSGFDNL